MERITALVFDIDRTLVVPGQPPSAATIAAVETCRALGLPCFVATARSQASSRIALGPLSWMADSGVFHNGGVGRCGISDFTSVDTIHAEVVATAIDVAVGFGTGWMAGERSDGADQIHVGLHTGDERPAFYPLVAPERMRLWGYDPDRLRRFETARCEPACKIIFWSEAGRDLGELAAALTRTLAKRTTVHFLDRGSSIIMTAPGCNKGSMALRLLAHRGLDPSATAAFGDDTTDVPMLKAVGHGIAMGDGHAAALAAARWRTGSARDDGVAAMLARLRSLMDGSAR